MTSYLDSNKTLFDQVSVDDKNIDPKKSTFWLILASAALFSSWCVFLTFYLSRISGRCLAFLINRYLQWTKSASHLHIGSFSVSLLSGKIMFRDLIFDNRDFTLQINDGWLIFSYWKFIRSSRADLQGDTSRLHLSLNGVRLFWYNRMARYEEIARFFHVEKLLGMDSSTGKKQGQQPPDSGTPAEYWDRIWSLVGTVRVDVGSGQLVAGNHTLPYMSVISFEDLRSRIFLRASATDRALLTITGEMENARWSLVRHPDYDGPLPVAEPPRTMGDGFALLQSANVKLIYNQDILGFVTDDQQQVDVARPVWDSQWRFGDNTVISFGPWAEEQRARLYAFFFPPDYQKLQVTEMPSRGRRRIHVQHEARICLLKETSIDLWFLRGETLENVHTRCNPGSTLDISVWWVTLESGFSWSLRTSLLHVEMATSLPFTRLIECETFTLNANFQYPRVYNDRQTWTFEYRISKATAWFVWDHKKFFTDLIDAWMGEMPNDVCKFIPYTVDTKIFTDNFEIILLLNEFNWVDASDKQTENCEIAIVGDSLFAQFELPFVNFAPETIKVTYTIKGRQDLAIRSRYPIDSVSAPIFAALSRAANCDTFAPPSKAGRYSKGEEWHEWMRSEKLNVVLMHEYHPVANTVLSDLPLAFLIDNLPKKVDSPHLLRPDYLDVQLTVEGAEVKFTGLIIRAFLDLKNNYFGWYDQMTNLDLAESEVGPAATASAKLKSKYNAYSPAAKPEQFRHMHVDVVVRICNPRLHAQLYSPSNNGNSSTNQPSSTQQTELCPTLMTDEFVVEVRKTVDGSLIQVALGPTCAYFDGRNSDTPPGYLTLTGLQFRGQALYSSVDVPWDMGVCEYGWLIEILVGELKGDLRFPANLVSLCQILESTLLLTLSPDDAMLVPERFRMCPHGQLQQLCEKRGELSVCEDEERLKYRMVRVAVDGVDILAQEGNNMLQLTASPVRFSLCNAEQDAFTEHLTVKASRIALRQAVRVNRGSPHSDEVDKWLEVGVASIENISLGVSLPLAADKEHLEPLRRQFVHRHDSATRRLHFLWDEERRRDCACTGDATFFAEKDKIGKQFLVSPLERLFVPFIVNEAGAQPGILQSVVNPNASVLSGQPYFAYKSPVAVSLSGRPRKKPLIHQQFSATDTDSYHSARSAASHDSVFGTGGVMNAVGVTSLFSYEEFLTSLELRRSVIDGPPRLGETPIGAWNQKRHSELKTIKEGINVTPFKEKRRSLQASEYSDSQLGQDKNSWKDAKQLVVSGQIAETIRLFYTPLGLASLECLLSSMSCYVACLHPATLLQIAYRTCVINKHKQPLLDSLFLEDTSSRELQIEFLARLPTIQSTLFQCEQSAQLTVPSSAAAFHMSSLGPSAALLTLVFEGAELSNELSLQTTTMPIVTQDAAKTSNMETKAKQQSYKLTTHPLSVQLIQLSHTTSADFRVSDSLLQPDLQWRSCPLASKMPNRQPRILFELHSPQIVVNFQRTPKYTKIAAAPSPITNILPHSSRLSLDMQRATTAERLHYYNSLKISISTVTSTWVMARALELTTRNEFPIYEALQPVISIWVNAIKQFEIQCSKISSRCSEWADMTLLRLLKQSFDCTDERVCVQGGRHRMAAVKRLGKHQCGCGSCLLTLTLFKYCAFASDSDSEMPNGWFVTSTREEFSEPKARKTALMALLSHWQPDISRYIKLVSPEEAALFKIQDLTPVNTMRNETHIDMSEVDANDNTNGTRSLSNLLHRKKHHSRNLSTQLEEGTHTETTEATTGKETTAAATPKIDLYHWVLNAHRERKERREGRKSQHAHSSEYVNPMDIVQKAFFYSIYRFRELEWTGLEEAAFDRIAADFELYLQGIDVKMIEQRIVNSLSDGKSYVTQHPQNLVQLKRLCVSGKLGWQVERDRRSVTPFYGLISLEYRGALDGIKISVDIGSMCLVKEVAAVIQAAFDAKVAVHQRAEMAEAGHESRRLNRRKRDSRDAAGEDESNEAKEAVEEEGSWEDKVIEIRRDFEKNLQLMKTIKDNRGEILSNMTGEFVLESLRVETARTNVNVSFTTHPITLNHRRLPTSSDPDTSQRVLANLSFLSSTSLPGQNQSQDPNVTSSSASSSNERNRDFDLLKLHLNKAMLMVMESDTGSGASSASGQQSQQQSHHIFSATLSASKATFNRKISGNSKAQMQLAVVLGDMKGEMPMSAQILHDVVMKHGPQIEQQLTRLSAQPPPPGSTPLDAVLLPIVASSNTVFTSHPRSASTTLPMQSSLPHTFSAVPSARRPAIATVHFTLDVRSIELALNPLPSLRVTYLMHGATSSGVTGDEANWRASITKHEAEFSVTTRDMENINLPLPSISCQGQYTIEKEIGHHQKRPSTDKQLHYREGGYLQMVLTLGQVNHNFTTDLLNQILFAEQTFREDFKALLSRLKSSEHKVRSLLVATPEPPTTLVDKPPLLFSLQVQGTGIPWLQLTASTPTNIAVRFTIDSLDAQLTNKWVVKDAGSKKERIFGIAVIQLNAKLGQLVRVAQYAEVQQELQEVATFMTQVRVENKDRTSQQNAYSYHISVNRPIVLIKSTAIDKAILLWLNYKNTYDFWRLERSRLKSSKTSPRDGEETRGQEQTSSTNASEGSKPPARQHRSNSLSQAMFSPQPIQDVDINLSLSIVNGCYMCMPLFSQDLTEGMPALVLSLQKSDISVHIKKELACEAQFHEFKLNFVDHFDEQALSHNFVEAGRSSAQTNYFFFPQGSYKLCSKASVVNLNPQWMLSVRSEMRGMVIDLDHRIGKLTKLLVNTFSALGEDESFECSELEENAASEDDDLEMRAVEGADELLRLPLDKRVPWLERKMHEQSKLVFDLQAKNAPEKSIEQQTKKLRNYELLRFKEFRRTLVEKLKKRSERSTGASTRQKQIQVTTTGGSSPVKQPITTADIAYATELPAQTPPETTDGDTVQGATSMATKEKERPSETVNMHIDVKISIESGSCTLRTTPKSSGNLGEKRRGMTSRPSLRDLRKGQTGAQQTNTTVFSIPSVDLKGYYTSDVTNPASQDHQLINQLQGEKNAPILQDTHAEHSKLLIKQSEERLEKLQSMRPTGSASNLQPMGAHKMSHSRRGSDVFHRQPKRGCFYLFVGLSSMPSETVVTPHLAYYVEQVLEPLPPSSVFRSNMSYDESAMEEDEELASELRSQRRLSEETAVNNIVSIDTTILPLDVMLYLNVQSSKILFDGCEKDSYAANCILQLPRLTLMASTKRSDNSEYPGGIDFSGTLSEFSLGIYSPHQDIREKFALQLTLDHFCFVITRNKNASNELENKVRFVLTSEVGAAVFDCDMKRLKELIQFPKPWYRPAIMRRVFFGDQQTSTTTTAQPPKMTRSRLSSTASYLRTPTHHSTQRHAQPSNQQEAVKKPWQATVLMLMQWKQLTIQAQTGNAMGKTQIEARKGMLSSSAKLSSRTEHDVTASFELESARFHAFGGAVSGEIELNEMRFALLHQRHFRDTEFRQALPHNSASASFKLLSVQIEYVTRKVLVAHCVQPTLSLHDEYSVERDKNTVKKALVLLHVNGSWQDLEVIIAKDTINDFINIVNKLKSFFEEQLRGSKLLWKMDEDSTTLLSQEDLLKTIDEQEYDKPEPPPTALWDKLLTRVSYMQLKNYLMSFPEDGNTVIGGVITLHANQLSIACMHGDITAQTWGLFHFREPTLVFKPSAKLGFLSTQGRNTKNTKKRSDEDIDVNESIVVVELQHEFIMRLGASRTDPVPTKEAAGTPSRDKAKEVMGLVLKVQRDRRDTSVNVPVKTHLRKLIGEVLQPPHKDKNSSPAASPPHSLVVFQFPALEALMKSEQICPTDSKDEDDIEPPKVLTHFIVSFDSEVGVLTDVSTQVQFLPELLKSYFKTGDGPQASSSVEHEPRHKTDIREYVCKQWQVEPRIKCIERSAFMWNPPLVDEILRRLQILNYRHTIPKALQRTVLDPLDQSIAHILLALLKLVNQPNRQLEKKHRRKHLNRE